MRLGNGLVTFAVTLVISHMVFVTVNAGKKIALYNTARN